MKNGKKKLHLLLYALLFLLCLIPCRVIQAGAEKDYTVDSYDVDIKVNENNVLDITETIQVNFLTERHGIVREIPRINSITRQDGSTSTVRAKISNISCSDPSVFSSGTRNYSIKLGEEDKMLTGPHTYTICYFYDIGMDTLDGGDEFYFNIIGPEWDTTIGQTTFSIHMPKKFDAKELGFSSGPVGTAGSEDVYYSAKGNTITGECDTVLNPGDALTVRLTLPEGYFVRKDSASFLFSYIVIGLSLLFLVVGVFIWFYYGKNPKVQLTTEYHPPKELNSAEAAFVYYGRVTIQSILSLIFDLAGKGCWQIEEGKEQGMFTEEDTFRIYPEKASYRGIEHEFYSAVFSSRHGKEYVTHKDFDRKFSRRIMKIKKTLGRKENAATYFTSRYLGRRIAMYAMIILDFLLISYEPLVDYIGSSAGLFFCLFPIFGVFFIMFMFSAEVHQVEKILGIACGIIFSVATWCGMILPGVLLERRYIITYVIGIICCSILLVLSNFMQKRTDYGNIMYGKIKSFRQCLQTMDQSRLKALQQEDPEYFSEILPYIYALNIKNIWTKERRNWYWTSCRRGMWENFIIFRCRDITHFCVELQSV